jgi:hypothetical protein
MNQQARMANNRHNGLKWGLKQIQKAIGRGSPFILAPDGAACVFAYQGATEAFVGSSRALAAFVVGQGPRSAERSHIYLSGIGSLRKERSVAGMLLEKEMEWLRGQDRGRSETRRLQAANNWPSLRLLFFLLLSIMPSSFWVLIRFASLF